MKQSVFVKEWEVSGPAQTVKGKIVVTMNYNSTVVTGTHALTHDTFMKREYMSKIEGFLNDVLFWIMSN